MNTRSTLSAALAATTFLALAPAQAQAPSIATSQLEAKVQAMQSQINALQAQVQHLQQQLRSVAPLPATGPAYQMPSLPKFTVPQFTVPKFTMPNVPGTAVAPSPRSRDNSIPDYTATFITQPAH